MQSAALPRRRCLDYLLLLAGAGVAQTGSATTSEILQGSGMLAGGQSISLAIPEPREHFALLLSESGVDLVIERPDRGTGAFANPPGRRWGTQVQVAWDLPVQAQNLVVRPLLARAPSGSFSYQWYPLSGAAAERVALRAQSRAAELAPARQGATTQAAIALFDEALSTKLTGPGIDPAEIHFRIGQLHSRSDSYDAEQSAYRASLTLLEQRSDSNQGKGHVLDALSMSLLRGMRLAEAVEINVAAFHAASEAADDYQRAVIVNNGCLMIRSDMRAAADCFLDALAVYQDVGLVEHQSAVLTNLSAAYTNLGEGHAALAALEQALSLRNGAAGDDDLLARSAVLSQLARTNARLGRYDQALGSGQEAFVLARRVESPFHEIEAVRALSIVHLELGQEDRAGNLLRALAEREIAPGRASVRLQLSAVSIESDPQRRVELLAALQSKAQAVGDDLSVTQAQLSWAAEVRTTESPARREEALRGALAVANRLGLVAQQVEAIELLAELRDVDEASRMLAQAEILARSADLPSKLHSVLYAQARLAKRVGDWQQARTLVLAADQVEDRLSLRLQARQRYSFLAAQRQSQFFALSLAGAGGNVSTESGNWVLQRLLRSRSQLWQQQSRRRLANEHVEYGRALEHLSFLLDLASENEDQATATLKLDIEAAIAAVEALEAQPPERRSALTLEGIQASLQPGDRALLIAAGNPRSLAVAIGPNSHTLIELADVSLLQPSAARVRAGLSRQDPLGQKALAGRMRDLAEILLPAFDAVAEADSVFVLTDPMLDAVPVEVLAGVDPAAGAAYPHYLRWGGNAYDSARSAQLRPEHRQSLVLLSDSTPYKANLSASKLPSLPNVAVEIEQIAAQVDPESVLRLSGREAASWLLSAQQRAGIVHIAAHALNQSIASASSVLALAGSEPEGRVSIGNLHANSVVSDLTVLSGCSTGVAANGEFNQGFAEAFLSAGSKRVLATLWPVDDAASAAFMADFYSRLLADDSRSEPRALAASKNHFANSLRWRDPYWWAGYQLWSNRVGSTPTATELAVVRSH